MSFWTLLDFGASTPDNARFCQRVTLWIGRRLALRHRHVRLAASARIHAGAKLHPREGAIEIGEESTVADGAVIQGNVTIGRFCSIQMYSILRGYGKRDASGGKIILGDGVRIASHVMMIAANHNFSDTMVPIFRQGMTHAPISIGNDVWVGGLSIITAGVAIGSGSVIGAGSVVTKDIPPMSIAVGSPARVIRKRTSTGNETISE